MDYLAVADALFTDSDKPGIVAVAQQLIDYGFKIVATAGTEQYLTEKGIEFGDAAIQEELQTLLDAGE